MTGASGANAHLLTSFGVTSCVLCIHRVVKYTCVAVFSSGLRISQLCWWGKYRRRLGFFYAKLTAGILPSNGFMFNVNNVFICTCPKLVVTLHVTYQLLLDISGLRIALVCEYILFIA
ncbi:hypothetical protein [Collimonas sp.]|uniref:hypothetical protein n=1 Tax=Collimonas sp. TaxID=1963772 RepID=UPI002B584A3E|nr:hypothetical protein [Collimonas sp.]HWW04411.1 hypothetical protein [Collimonas sp.]